MTAQSRLERQAGYDAATMHAVVKRLPKVLVNLGDALPDSPGSATAGTGGTSTSSPVERALLAGTLQDLAVLDWARLQELSRKLAPLVEEYGHLTSRWCFDRRDGNANEARPISDEMWCASCLRIDACNPRSRGDLCDWCYRYKLGDGQGELPPIVILMARKDGRRITEAMVKHAKAAGPAIERKRAREKAKR